MSAYVCKRCLKSVHAEQALPILATRVGTDRRTVRLSLTEEPDCNPLSHEIVVFIEKEIFLVHHLF